MEELRMSGKERIWLEAFGRVKRGELSVVAAAELVGLSLRQARRQWKRFKGQGAAGLVHRLRGRLSNRRLAAEVRDRVVKRHQERYADFGATLACEKLAEEGLVLCPDTLRAFLKERGLWQRKRRRGRHRKRRERRSCLGSLVQMDGSHHDWFEGRSGKCVLMVMIDDATNLTYARLYPAESTEAAFDVTGRWIGRQGLPRSLYVDRHSIYRDEDHPPHPTQFGRAMKELSVELILAHSPQAKGRVERRNAVFQDRLVKELRLRNIDSMEPANVFLEAMFLDDLNRRYAVTPRLEQDLHRSVPAGVLLQEVLCVQEKRVVGQDWCVRWQNRWLQIDVRHAVLNLPRRGVLVKHLADGQLIVEHKGERLTFTELPAKPLATKKKKVIVNNRRWKPGTSHPWNRESARRLDPPVSLAPAAPARDLQAEKRKKAG
jgi:transposase